jgi:hypothetical protein
VGRQGDAPRQRLVLRRVGGQGQAEPQVDRGPDRGPRWLPPGRDPGPDRRGPLRKGGPVGPQQGVGIGELPSSANCPVTGHEPVPGPAGRAGSISAPRLRGRDGI